jgi:hypothetical protein
MKQFAIGGSELRDAATGALIANSKARTSE